MSNTVTSLRPDVIEVDVVERELLDAAARAITSAKIALAEAREHALNKERYLLEEIEKRRNEAEVLVGHIGNRHSAEFQDRQGAWDYSPEAGGFVRKAASGV